MVVETDDKEERTDETSETPMTDSALIGWLGAIHAEILAQRVEMREMREETRAEIREVRVEMRESREETRAEIREARVEMRELSSRTGRLEERVARIEAGIEAERGQKNRLIMWLGIGIGALIGVVGVIGLLN